jgi:tetratricopeptide (TPR) repeat protein
MAKVVGGHLLMAGELLEEDPELALKHAEAARRYGSRLPVVREAVGETAYAAGEFSTALNEYRTLYRMSGDENYLPVIADCERAIGKPNLALETLAKADTQRMETAQLVEAKLVQAGARADLGQTDEALRLLKAAVSSGFGGRVGQARLHYAYADLLERSGDEEHARDNFRAVTRLDPADDLGAAEKLDELDGVGFVLEDDPDEEITEDDLQETEDTDAAGLMGQAPKSPTPDDSEADADD